MRIYKIVFSPTGGTKKALDFFSEDWGEAREIDLTSRTEDFGKWEFAGDDVCLVGMPVFGGRVPETALERLRKMRGNGAGAVAVAVYGNRHYDDALLEMKNELEAAGFRLKGAVAAVAEHSIVRKFAAGRPDEKDREQLRRFAKEIRAAWPDERVILVPGNPTYREYHGLPFQPVAGGGCTACGICARQCPTGAIPPENPRNTDKKACISCVRCVAVCPQHARKMNPLLVEVTAKKLKKFCEVKKENERFL